MKIRDLQPGAAWNDAERRSIPIGIVGFFLSGLLSTFGVLDAIPSAFAAGVCGALAFYFGTVALFIGYYHKRMLLGASSAASPSASRRRFTAAFSPWSKSTNV